MEKISQQARQHLATLLVKTQEYGELGRQAAQLQDQLTLARAFMSREREHLAEVAQPIVMQLLYGLTWWALSGDHHRQVVASNYVSERVPAARMFRISLADLLLWAQAGVMTEEERKLLESMQ